MSFRGVLGGNVLSATIARAAGGGEAGPDFKITLSFVVRGAERSSFILKES
jgi:hypothetical protein